MTTQDIEPFGGIDAGGTKWLCAIGTSPDDIRSHIEIPTRSPKETLGDVRAFFGEWIDRGLPLRAIGLSSFGPVVRERHRTNWGHLHNAPKQGWEHTDIGPWLKANLKVEVGIDTDVNGAALAEHRWGEGSGVSDMVYITLGTGLGGAAIANGQLVVGGMHSEMGHIRPRRHVDDDYEGMCPYHADCYEGLISGPAIKGSTGDEPAELAESDVIWKFVAYYLGQLCSGLIYNFSPKRIVMGGGLMRRDHLLPLIRANTAKEIAGYLRWPSENNLADIIVQSRWVAKPRPDKLNAGVFGGFLIAEAALTARLNHPL